ncbi:MAG: glycosyltransferase family 4 protein [Candidatus Hodarchaeales archaeon]
MPSSKAKKPLIMYLMRFESLKKGSFERFLLSLVEKARHEFEFVFVFMAKPPDWLHSALVERGASVDWAYLVTGRHGFQEIDRLVSQYRPDIAHFHFFSLISPFIPYVRWRHGLKVIVHVHSVIPYSKGKTRIRTYLIPLRKYAFCRSVDSVICVSDFVKAKTLSEFANLDSKAMTVYNGLDWSSFNRSKSIDFRSVLGLSERPLVLFTAAWLIKIKGIDVAIKSLPLVSEKVKEDIQLVIAGDGEELEELMELAKSLGVYDRVHFLGWRNDVPEMIQAADIVITPSVCEEACSYLILESMAMGKPVVGSNVGGIPELLKVGGEVGLLFRSGDERNLAELICRLFEDQRLYRKISIEARRKAYEKFHINKQIEAIEEIYRAFLKHQGSGKARQFNG